VIRTAVLAVFVFGVVGLLGELVLLEHTEDFWQLTPLVLLGASPVLLVWHARSRGTGALRAFQVLMGFFIISGIAGLILHYQGNVEFELEMQPGARGLALVWEALKGATPALAPGTMLQLGFLGLVYTYQHPRLSAGWAHSTE
jgi:hypothetical protein